MRLPLAFAATGLVVLAALLAGAASAHQSPSGCTSIGVSISLAAFRSDGVTPIGGEDVVEGGESVLLRTTLGLPAGNVCDFEGGTVTITTPDGVVSPPMGPVSVVTASSSWSSPFVTYVVDPADASEGVLFAGTSYGCGSPVDAAKCTNGQSYGVAHTGASEPHTNRVAAAGGVSMVLGQVALEVSKTADPAYDREHLWDITKTVDVPEHEMENGMSGGSTYTVTLIPLGFVDTDHRVSGTITIRNPSAVATAEIVSIVDEITGGIVPVPACPEALPISLAPGETIVCTYEAALPDDASRTNTVTVGTSGPIEGGSASASFGFEGLPPETILNENVDVTDSWSGPLPGAGPWSYTRTFVCGEDEGQHDNVATIVQTGQTAEASVLVLCGELVPDKAVDKIVATPGDSLLYTVTVSHSGTATITKDVVDTYDCRLVVDADSITGGGVLDVDACTITWSDLTMGPDDADVMFQFSAAIPKPLEMPQASPICVENGLGDSVVNTVTVGTTSVEVVTCIVTGYPASCVGHAVRIDLADASGIPGNAVADNTYSWSAAVAGAGTGVGHGDAQQGGLTHAFPTVVGAGITFSGAVSTGKVHSACDASVWGGRGSAAGVAETDGLQVDAVIEGLPFVPADPVTFRLTSTTLRESGASADGAGSVGANVYDLAFGGVIGTVPYGGTLFAGPAPPNTLVPLTLPLSEVSPLLTDVTIGHVILNAQGATADPLTSCRTDDGTALIVVLYDLTGASVTSLPLPPVVTVPTTPLVTTSVSHVAVTTCPDTGPGGEPEVPLLGSCSAAAVLADVSTSHLSATPWGAFSGFSRSSAVRHVAGGSATGEARQFDLNAVVGPGPAALPTGALQADAAVSACEVKKGSNHAAGEATINDLDLELDVPGATVDGTAGIQIDLAGQALHTSVAVTDGSAAFAPNFVDYTLVVEGVDIPVDHQPAANTKHQVLSSGTLLVEVILNHQESLGGCEHEGNAIRLRVFDPLAGGALLLEVKVGHVRAMAC